MNLEEIKLRLEVVSKIGAIAAVGLYVAGFLVVTVQHASYGIVEFSFFRAKILSAGILFSIFVILPFVEASKAHGIFGFEARIPNPEEIGETMREHPFWVSVFRNSNFIFSAWVISVFLWLLFGNYGDESRFFTVGISYAVIFAGVSIFLRGKFAKYPWQTASSLAALNVLAFMTMLTIHEWLFCELLCWFIYVGWFAGQMVTPLRNSSLLRDVNWHLVLFNTLGTISFFALIFYPKLKPSIGGGKPTKVVLQFVTTSPIDNSSRSEVWLLDEVDGGYFVLKNQDDGKAVFLAKPLVSAIFFSADT